MTAPARLPIATIAAQVFRQRQQRAREVVRNQGMARATAEAHLRPWLAIACTCGADLPELAEILADRRAMLADTTPGPRLVTKDGIDASARLNMESRWLAAEDVCPRATWAPILAAARVDAFNRYVADANNPALVTAAATLQRLALHLAFDINGHHVPPYRAPVQQQAAA